MGYGLTAITLVFLSGAIGCRCSGSAGLVGIALGAITGATVPWLASRATSPRG